MADSLVGYVIEHLANDDDLVRELALAWLCEGYMNEPQIAETVFKQWDLRTPESAYATFTIAGYFPIARHQVAEACARAQAMALAGGELTSTTTRCAGKLLEQIVRLPANQLRDHWDAISETAQSHKIFFRVDLRDLASRLALLDKSADELAQLLEQSIEALASDPNNATMFRQSQHALEALRFEHPNYLDLSAVLKADSNLLSSAASLTAVLSNLVQFSGDDWHESDIANWLGDSRENVLSSVIESLVRRGSGLAAQVLVDHFLDASDYHRRWIARGLQRMRVHGLAPLIGQLRERVSDHSLWMMMLVAEIQQLDPARAEHFVDSIQDLNTASQALLDAATLYAFVCAPLQTSMSPRDVESACHQLLQRVHQHLEATQPTSQQDMRSVRRNQARQIDKLYNKRRP